MAEEEKPEKDSKENPFNMSIQTLIRIDGTVKDIASSYVNDNVIGMKRNLRVMMIYSLGFFGKVEKKKAREDWKKISLLQVSVNDENEIIYDPDLPVLMDRFFEWLYVRLHANGVVMAGKRDYMEGLARIYNKYSMKKNG